MAEVDEVSRIRFLIGQRMLRGIFLHFPGENVLPFLLGRQALRRLRHCAESGRVRGSSAEKTSSRGGRTGDQELTDVFVELIRVRPPAAGESSLPAIESSRACRARRRNQQRPTMRFRVQICSWEPPSCRHALSVARPAALSIRRSASCSCCWLWWQWPRPPV